MRNFGEDVTKLGKTGAEIEKRGYTRTEQNVGEHTTFWKNGTALIKRVGIREGVCNSFGGKFSLHMFKFFN